MNTGPAAFGPSLRGKYISVAGVATAANLKLARITPFSVSLLVVETVVAAVSADELFVVTPQQKFQNREAEFPEFVPGVLVAETVVSAVVTVRVADVE